MSNITPWIVLAIFTIAHIASKWADHRDEREPVSFWRYIRNEAPAKSFLAVLTSIGLGFVMLEMEAFNAVTALTAGWSSNSLMDHFAKRGQSVLG